MKFTCAQTKSRHGKIGQVKRRLRCSKAGPAALVMLTWPMLVLAGQAGASPRQGPVRVPLLPDPARPL